MLFIMLVRDISQLGYRYGLILSCTITQYVSLLITLSVFAQFQEVLHQVRVTKPQRRSESCQRVVRELSRGCQMDVTCYQ